MRWITLMFCVSVWFAPPAISDELEFPDDGGSFVVQKAEGGWSIDAALASQIVPPAMSQQLADEPFEFLFETDAQIDEALAEAEMNDAVEQVFATGRIWSFEDDDKPDRYRYLIGGKQGITRLLVFDEEDADLVATFVLFVIPGETATKDVLLFGLGADMDELVPMRRVSLVRQEQMQQSIQTETE